MATHAPQTFDPTRVPHLSGRFAPVTEEVDETGLEVTGELPAELDGLFLRNGPNPRFSPIGSFLYASGPSQREYRDTGVTGHIAHPLRLRGRRG